MEPLTPTQLAVRNCIFRGTALVIVVYALAVCACLYEPSLALLTKSDLWGMATLVLLLVAIGALLAAAVAPQPLSRSAKRALHAVLGLAVAMAFVYLAHSVSRPETVVVVLLTAAAAVAAASLAGARATDLSHWGRPLAVGLVVLLVAGLINAVVLGSNAIETALSLGGIVVYVALTAYETNMYVRRPDRCAPYCCEDGVFNSYFNFVSIAKDMLYLAE
jgi:FtsH-binding integral membrane protein